MLKPPSNLVQEDTLRALGHSAMQMPRRECFAECHTCPHRRDAGRFGTCTYMELLDRSYCARVSCVRELTAHDNSNLCLVRSIFVSRSLRAGRQGPRQETAGEAFFSAAGQGQATSTFLCSSKEDELMRVSDTEHHFLRRVHVVYAVFG